jgi:hypothetical protein
MAQADGAAGPSAVHRMRQVSGALLDARHTDGVTGHRKPGYSFLKSLVSYFF